MCIYAYIQAQYTFWISSLDLHKTTIFCHSKPFQDFPGACIFLKLWTVHFYKNIHIEISGLKVILIIIIMCYQIAHSFVVEVCNTLKVWTVVSEKIFKHNSHLMWEKLKRKNWRTNWRIKFSELVLMCSLTLYVK